MRPRRGRMEVENARQSGRTIWTIWRVCGLLYWFSGWCSQYEGFNRVVRSLGWLIRLRWGTDWDEKWSGSRLKFLQLKMFRRDCREDPQWVLSSCNWYWGRWWNDDIDIWYELSNHRSRYVCGDRWNTYETQLIGQIIMLTVCTNRSCSVVVITLVSDTGDLGSIPSRTFLFCAMSNRDIFFSPVCDRSWRTTKFDLHIYSQAWRGFSLLVGEW